MGGVAGSGVEIKAAGTRHGLLVGDARETGCAASQCPPSGRHHADVAGVEVFAVGCAQQFGLSGAAYHCAAARDDGIGGGVDIYAADVTGAVPPQCAAAAAAAGIYHAGHRAAWTDGAEAELVVGRCREACDGEGRGGDVHHGAGACGEASAAVFTHKGVGTVAVPGDGCGVLGEVGDGGVGGHTVLNADVVDNSVAADEPQCRTAEEDGASRQADGEVLPGGGEGDGVERYERRGVAKVGH